MLEKLLVLSYYFVSSNKYIKFIFLFYFRPELKPIEKEIEVVLRFPETEGLSPPILQLNEVTFAYPGCKNVLENINLGATLESRICIVS